MLHSLLHVFLNLAFPHTLQMTLRSQPLGPLPPFSVRLGLSALGLSGRLNLGLPLVKEPPGVK